MESGSIFVCFLCEKEFREVDSLQEHMKDHDSLPEMFNKFPSRKRGYNKEKSNTHYKKKQKVTFDDSLTPKSVETATSNDEDPPNAKNVEWKVETCSFSQIKPAITTPPVLKKLPATSKRGFFLSRAQYQTPVAEKLTKTREAVKEKFNSSNSKQISSHKLSEQIPEDKQMLKAMRLKQIILRREMLYANKSKAAAETKPNVIEEDESEIDNVNDNFESFPQNIITVDSPFFSSGSSSKIPLGPTVINAEPDGFICTVPQKSYVSGAPYQKKKKSFARYRSYPS